MDIRLIQFDNYYMTITTDGRVYNRNRKLIMKNCIKWFITNSSGIDFSAALIAENGDVWWLEVIYTYKLGKIQTDGSADAIATKEFHVNPDLIGNRNNSSSKYDILILYGNDSILCRNSHHERFDFHDCVKWNVVPRYAQPSKSFSECYILDVYNIFCVLKTSDGYIIKQYSYDIVSEVSIINDLDRLIGFDDIFAYGNCLYFNNYEATEWICIKLPGKCVNIMVGGETMNYIEICNCKECHHVNNRVDGSIVHWNDSFCSSTTHESIHSVYLYDPKTNINDVIKYSVNGKMILYDDFYIIKDSNGKLYDLTQYTLQQDENKVMLAHPIECDDKELKEIDETIKDMNTIISKDGQTTSYILYVKATNTYKICDRLYDIEFYW